MRRWILSSVGIFILMSLLASAPWQATTPTPTDTPQPTLTPAPTLTPTVPVYLPPGAREVFTYLRDNYQDAGGWGLLRAFILLVIAGLVVWAIAKYRDRWGERLPGLAKKPPQPASEDERRELDDQYLEEFKKSPQLADPTPHINAYLSELANQARLPGDEHFIPLEGGIDLSPTVGLAHLPQKVEGPRTYNESQIFPDISQVLSVVDPRSGSPYPAFALLGEPGSGKSTLLRKLVREAIEERQKDAEARLPIFVSLSAHKRGSPLEFLRRHFVNEAGYDGLQKALNEGRVWLFADGLNEMDRRRYDHHVTQWQDFLRIYFQNNGNRAIFASRRADYEDGTGLGELPRLYLHPLNEDRIKDFLWDCNPRSAPKVWDALKRDRQEGSGGLYELAGVPFWLVMMEGVSTPEGLPGSRAEIMQQSIQDWLVHEASREGGCILDKNERAAFWAGMTHLGWNALMKGQNPVLKMTRVLGWLAKDKTLAEKLLQTACSCDLLVADAGGETVRYRHQLLQEYFAGRELKERFLRHEDLSGLWRIPWGKWKYDKKSWQPLSEPLSTGWEEATVMAAGMLGTESGRLVQGVLKENPPLAARCASEEGTPTAPEIKEAVQKRLVRLVEEAGQRLPLRLAAGKALGKLGDPRILKGKGSIPGADGKQVEFIEPQWAAVAEGSYPLGSRDEDAKWLKKQGGEIYGDEQPGYVARLAGFHLGRYPVSVAEYAGFWKAGGYQDETWWPEGDARRWLRGEIQFEESYWYRRYQLDREQAEDLQVQIPQWVKQGRWSPDQAKTAMRRMQMSEEDYRRNWEAWEKGHRDGNGVADRPYLWEEPRYTNPSQPVIGVSWYEAQAYCLWLTEMLKAAGRLPVGGCVRLPREAEWEAAARGQGRRFWPWGNTWDEKRANTLEGRVMLPSALGVYAQGASACGAQDMAGNVWEWCADWYDSEEYARRAALGEACVDPGGPADGQYRAVRGGSWLLNRSGARCAYRNWLAPDNFLSYVGFPVVLSPRS